MEETFISVPEQGGGALILAGPLNPGVLHTVAHGSSGHPGPVSPGNAGDGRQWHGQNVGPRQQQRCSGSDQSRL